MKVMSVKNKSFQHPFPTLDDKFFDKNNDGKLNTVETLFRDAHLSEMNQKVQKDENSEINNNSYNQKSNDNSGKLFSVIAVVIALIFIIIKLFY